MKRLGLVSLLFAGCVSWTTRDTVMELSFVGEQAVDTVQTQEAVGYDAEMNPLIGSHGQVIPPLIYFPFMTLIHAGISAALPPKWRIIWQAATIGAEGDNIVGNIGSLNSWKGK